MILLYINWIVLTSTAEGTAVVKHFVRTKKQLILREGIASHNHSAFQSSSVSAHFQSRAIPWTSLSLDSGASHLSIVSPAFWREKLLLPVVKARLIWGTQISTVQKCDCRSSRPEQTIIRLTSWLPTSLPRWYSALCCKPCIPVGIEPACL